jgi:hypothetical protein
LNTIDDNRMAAWHALTEAQQAEAIRAMADSGFTDHGISAATRLAVEQVRRVLGERVRR